ncbi:hypothetical protein CSE16_20085 [Solibacillus sp. R5-41]|uniref:hypothetical protein n=1 Tax=Solibacillus sp. R5-41 TaxID=2048654 RepID=UPI000C1299B1|nr:hypothetical protein [Solibacillus sp. R5-41]ATP42123.1 hypothetical protein CSE16_20085 [Solibacillus sp. R5-41]
MKTFSFKLFGGYNIYIDQKEMKIEYLGEKWWIITKAKPRTKVIPFEGISRVDYKESGMTFGYVRLITNENIEYPSSSYVAQHDENAFMVEKDELAKLNEVLDLLKKHNKKIEFAHLKA